MEYNNNTRAEISPQMVTEVIQYDAVTDHFYYMRTRYISILLVILIFVALVIGISRNTICDYKVDLNTETSKV